MATKIRRATITCGTAVAGVANVSWDDEVRENRDQADDEDHGDPVITGFGGSGTIELLSGKIASGYGTASLVASYKEITVANGVETPVTKTATFTKPVFACGANIPAEGIGKVNVKFTYGKCTLA